MSPVRWEFLEDVPALRRQMDHLFDSLLGAKSVESKMGQWAPTIDEMEADNEIVVKAELPGVDEKELSVTLLGNTLRIKGEKKSEQEEKGRHFHRMESYYGSFERTLPLPVSVDAEKIKAEYKNGVLEVHLPKKPELKAKQVLVSHK